MTPSAITPYQTTMKDGFSMVTCAKDEMLLNADKHGDGKFSYTMGAVSNVSIIHYTEMIAREDLETMTVEVCYGFCRTIPEMHFFGITNGRDCYCTPYFKQVAGDSSDCDAPCDGNPTTMCGGKSKSSIYEMHQCNNTAEDLATADSLANTSLVTLSAVEADVAAAGASMQEAGAKLQEAFGQVGDPVAAGNCQKAKDFAGEVVHAAEAGATAATTLTELRAKAAGGALDTIEATEELTVSLSKATEAADANKLALTKVAKKAIAPTTNTSIQYYSVMYFVDKDFVDMPSTCGGDLAADPLVGDHGNCAAACDNVVGECVGYSYMADGSSGLCFLFSKFTTVTYYTGGAKAEGFLQRREEPLSGPPPGEMPSKEMPSKEAAPAGVTAQCVAKLSEFEGTNITPQGSGKCKNCLKELTKADRSLPAM